MSPARLIFTMVMMVAFAALGWALVDMEGFKRTLGLMAPQSQLERVLQGGPLECEGEAAVYCDRDAYVARALPACIGSLPPDVVNAVGDAEAVCRCIASEVFGRFTRRELYLVDQGAAPQDLADRLIDSAMVIGRGCGIPGPTDQPK